jgi:hypothetical protein
MPDTVTAVLAACRRAMPARLAGAKNDLFSPDACAVPETGMRLDCSMAANAPASAEIDCPAGSKLPSLLRIRSGP